MKRLLIMLLLVFSLTACEGILNKTDLIDEITYIEWNDLSHEFKVGETIPDWNNYFEVPEGLEYEKIEIQSDFLNQEVFSEEGEFTVQVKIILIDGLTVFESITVKVMGADVVDEPSLSVFDFTSMLYKFETSEYLQYNASLNIDLLVGEEESSINQDMYYKHDLASNLDSGLMYIRGEFDYSGAEERIEMYFDIDRNYVDMYIKFSSEEDWDVSSLSFEEFEMMNDMDSESITTLLTGVTALEYTETETTYVVDIPLSSENYDMSMFSEIESLIDSLDYLYEYTNGDLSQEELNRLYAFIDLKFTVSKSKQQVTGFTVDIKDFMNEIMNIYGDEAFVEEVGELTYTKALYTVKDINLDHFVMELPDIDGGGTPIVTIDYTPAGYGELHFESAIRDAIVDTENNNIYYTLEGNHYVYSLNYETFEVNQLYFDILPDQLYYRDNKLYVTLSDKHEYYVSGEQYGGIGIIDITDFSIYKSHTLNFDPYDIVVDKDGFIYVTHGSHQHGEMRSINAVSGVVIQQYYGFYYLGEILYSDYTGNIYYVELMTSSDDLEVIDVNRGEFIAKRNGSDRFDENSLSMSPDGTKIISRDGFVFELNKIYEQDGLKSENLGFSLYSAAFDLDNGITYYAVEDGIKAIDNAGNEKAYYDYSYYSEGLYYDEEKLINVSTNTIEILDLSSTEESYYIDIITVSYGNQFDLQEYFNNIFGGEVVYTILSGTEDYTVIGQNKLEIYISEIYSQDVSIDVTLYINVVDNQGPEITLPTDTSFDLVAGETFTAPTCSATDNLDTNVTCEVYENNVNPNLLGDYEVKYKAVDSSGNITITSYTFTVSLQTQSYTTTVVTFPGLIGEAVYDEVNNAVYYLRLNTQELVKYDLLNSAESTIQLSNTPERILLQDGKLYVTLLHGEHSSYWWDDEQTGEIAIIDVATFTLESSNVVQVDPYEIAVIDGFIYIFSGSGQSNYLHAYDLTDFQTPIKSCHLRQKTVISYDKNSNYIFGINTDLSPQSLMRYEVENGTCTAVVDDPGHGDYRYGSDIFVSPNNDFVFSELGQAFYQIGGTNFVILDYSHDIKFTISDVYFNTDTNETLFGQNNGYVYISYDASYGVSEEINIGYGVNYITGDSEEFYVLSYGNNELFFITVTRDVE